MRGPMDDTILPIQIRPELTVLIQGLPHDLKQSEADKVVAVVAAYVVDQEEKETGR